MIEYVRETVGEVREADVTSYISGHRQDKVTDGPLALCTGFTAYGRPSPDFYDVEYLHELRD